MKEDGEAQQNSKHSYVLGRYKVLTDEEVVKIVIIENVQRVDLNPRRKRRIPFSIG